MHTATAMWVCLSCGIEEPRDAEAAMTTQDATEALEESCPAEGCDSDRASSEMMPKPGAPTRFGSHVEILKNAPIIRTAMDFFRYIIKLIIPAF